MEFQRTTVGVRSRRRQVGRGRNDQTKSRDLCDGRRPCDFLVPNGNVWRGQEAGYWASTSRL
jgi:hypothetical protein